MSEQREQRFSGALLLVIPFALMSVWYLNYAFHAWFQQDDYQFIHLYHASLHLHNLWDFGSFARFVSRNMYWHYLLQIFGPQALYFFIFNFLTIAGTSYLIFRIFEPKYDKTVAGVLALLYFASINVIQDFNWVSFSQHLIPIFLLFLFMGMFLTRTNRPWTTRDVFKLLFVLAIAFSSNALAVVALVIPAYVALRNKTLREDRKFRLFVFVGVLGALLDLYESHRFSNGIYATKISWAVVHQNLTYYFHNHLWEYLLALIFMLYVGWRKKNDYIAILTLICATSYVPYAFLVYQHTLGYMSLTCPTFFMAAILTLIELGRNRVVVKNMAAVIGVLIPFYFVNPSPLNNYWTVVQTGAANLKLVTEIKNFQAANPGYVKYCITSHTPEKSLSDVAPQWNTMARGMALTDFAVSTDSYKFYWPSQISAANCQVIVDITQSPSKISVLRN